jgi:hypothetical protein
MTTAPVWPISGDAPDLQTIVHAQAATITDNQALTAAYQAVLNDAQAVPPTSGTGTASGTPATTLTVSSVLNGPILINSTVAGIGIPALTTIVAQQSGTTGGNGVYTTNQATTASAAALTFTPGGGTTHWPVATDSPTLNTIMMDQTAIIRTQTALIQQYQQLLNDSATTPPATGP